MTKIVKIMPLFSKLYRKNKHILGCKDSCFPIEGWRVWISTHSLAILTDNNPDALQFFATMLWKDYTTFNVLIVMFDINNQPNIRLCVNINTLFKTPLNKPNPKQQTETCTLLKYEYIAGAHFRWTPVLVVIRSWGSVLTLEKSITLAVIQIQQMHKSVYVAAWTDHF